MELVLKSLVASSFFCLFKILCRHLNASSAVVSVLLDPVNRVPFKTSPDEFSCNPTKSSVHIKCSSLLRIECTHLEVPYHGCYTVRLLYHWPAHQNMTSLNSSVEIWKWKSIHVVNPLLGILAITSEPSHIEGEKQWKMLLGILRVRMISTALEETSVLLAMTRWSDKAPRSATTS